MNIDYTLQIGKKIAVNEKSRTKLIEIDTITHLTCNGYVTTLYLTDQDSISTSKLLKLFEEDLTLYGFIRANYNTLVNTKHISEIEFSSHSKSLYINDFKIKISRRRAFLFKKLKKNEFLPQLHIAKI